MRKMCLHLEDSTWVLVLLKVKQLLVWGCTNKAERAIQLTSWFILTLLLKDGCFIIFLKLPPCGFYPPNLEICFFCPTIVRTALPGIPQPHSLPVNESSFQGADISPNIIIGLALWPVLLLSQAHAAPDQSQTFRAPGLPSRAVISSSTVSEPLWLNGDWEALRAGMKRGALPGHRADLQNWPRLWNFTDSAAEGSLVWAFITWSKMCREER